MTKEWVSHRILELLQERRIQNVNQLVARCPEVVPQTIYNTAAGKSSPTVETLFFICKGLDVSLKDFFDEGTESFTPSTQERMAIEQTRRVDEMYRQRIWAYIDATVAFAEEKAGPDAAYTETVFRSDSMSGSEGPWIILSGRRRAP